MEWLSLSDHFTIASETQSNYVSWRKNISSWWLVQFCCSLLVSITFLETTLYYFQFSPTHPVKFKTFMTYCLVSVYGTPDCPRSFLFWFSKIFAILCSYSKFFNTSKYSSNSHVHNFGLQLMTCVWGQMIRSGEQWERGNSRHFDLLCLGKLAKSPKFFHCWNRISLLLCTMKSWKVSSCKPQPFSVTTSISKRNSIFSWIILHIFVYLSYYRYFQNKFSVAGYIWFTVV